MKNIKPKNYIEHRKLICDWTDKKKYSFQFRTLKFYVRYGTVILKNFEIISFRQSKRLGKHINFKTQNKIKPETILKKISLNCLVMVFSGKCKKMFDID